MRIIHFSILCLLAGSALAQMNPLSALQSDRNQALAFKGAPLSKWETSTQSRIEPDGVPALMNMTRDYLLRHSWEISLFDTLTYEIQAEITERAAFSTNRTTADFHFQWLTNVAQYKSAMLCLLRFSYFQPKPPRGVYIIESPVMEKSEALTKLELTEVIYSSLFDGIENRR